ncbi:Hypothetical predicted protein, partial [Pelobates cultripes]
SCPQKKNTNLGKGRKTKVCVKYNPEQAENHGRHFAAESCSDGKWQIIRSIHQEWGEESKVQKAELTLHSKSIARSRYAHLIKNEMSCCALYAISVILLCIPTLSISQRRSRKGSVNRFAPFTLA